MTANESVCDIQAYALERKNGQPAIQPLSNIQPVEPTPQTQTLGLQRLRQAIVRTIFSVSLSRKGRERGANVQGLAD